MSVRMCKAGLGGGLDPLLKKMISDVHWPFFSKAGPTPPQDPLYTYGQTYRLMVITLSVWYTTLRATTRLKILKQCWPFLWETFSLQKWIRWQTSTANNHTTFIFSRHTCGAEGGKFKCTGSRAISTGTLSRVAPRESYPRSKRANNRYHCLCFVNAVQSTMTQRLISEAGQTRHVERNVSELNQHQNLREKTHFQPAERSWRCDSCSPRPFPNVFLFCQIKASVIFIWEWEESFTRSQREPCTDVLDSQVSKSQQVRLLVHCWCVCHICPATVWQTLQHAWIYGQQ